MNPVTVELALSLIEIIRNAASTLKKLKDDDPATYALIAQHHADALAAAEAAALSP